MLSEYNLSNAVACYTYGSRVYGTFQKNSDWDYILIDEQSRDSEMDMGVINVTYMTPSHFQDLLDRHNITALECYFLPKDLVIKASPVPWQFKLSLVKLRHSLSEKASQSFVKAKKKFVAPYEWADKERERGKKSLFHSFRILNFGIQIASHGRITDYTAANHIFEEIMTNSSNDWEDYQKRWKPEFNELATEFKKIAPKE